jgi:hypothetical protein
MAACIAPWFGLPMCDPKSYPQNPCTPDSDSNTGDGTPSDAGSAFMELQFYPPGYAPFQDAGSCDQTRYCAALTIDSLECTLNFVTCNNNCIEPVNFAYLQTDGVPAGPPSPQLLNSAISFAPNRKTLFMNQGDVLKVTIQDTTAGLKTAIQDLTTGQSGFMVASAANGFMNTDLSTCNGTPFSFHPEYSTAAVQNRVPWAALEGGVLMEDEIGHFEPCGSVTNALPQSSPGFSDPSVFQTCVGSFEGGTGEGPCTATKCYHSTTIGGHPCTRKDFFCELSDALCMPKGPRIVTINGVNQVFSWPVAGCEQNAFQNGDLDFDGSSYIADWPDGGSTHPTPFNYVGPLDAVGNAYPQIQIETDGADEEQSCNFATGAGCTIPAQGAAFYPFWTLASPQTSQSQVPNTSGQCVWNFGNTIAGQTTDSRGGTGEYGRPDVSWFAGTLISPVEANPALNSKC